MEARTHWSVLVAGHGGTAALRGGVPSVTGHGKAQREAHGLRGDHANLPMLPRLVGMRRQGLSACAVVRRRERGGAGRRVPRRRGNDSP